MTKVYIKLETSAENIPLAAKTHALIDCDNIIAIEREFIKETLTEVTAIVFNNGSMIYMVMPYEEVVSVFLKAQQEYFNSKLDVVVISNVGIQAYVQEKKETICECPKYLVCNYCEYINDCTSDDKVMVDAKLLNNSLQTLHELSEFKRQMCE